MHVSRGDGKALVEVMIAERVTATVPAVGQTGAYAIGDLQRWRDGGAVILFLRHDACSESALYKL